MSGWTLREPSAADWPSILELANASLAEIPHAPPQDEWLANRRAYLQGGRRHHVVAVEDGHVVGYAAAEHALHQPQGEYRVFVVAMPAARETLGTYLLREILRYLRTMNAQTVRMLEYEADAGFLAYLESRGFARRRTFTLADGTAIVELRLNALFEASA